MASIASAASPALADLLPVSPTKPVGAVSTKAATAAAATVVRAVSSGLPQLQAPVKTAATTPAAQARLGLCAGRFYSGGERADSKNGF